MGVSHRLSEVSVTKQFREVTDFAAIFKIHRCRRVSEEMRIYSYIQTSLVCVLSKSSSKLIIIQLLAVVR
ncbi:hypothetical protein D1872_308930 [compost metagenome]